MNEPVTELMHDEDLRRAEDLSLHRSQPPLAVPGYTMERLLGKGAFGEVWQAEDRNTGRRVAIKFYAHRGGLDWSLLSREVEKLRFLSTDRYVVQLLQVGWEADPPFYIMEYMENGSLEEVLRKGPLPVGPALALFREVIVGLVHAHNKGIFHCDLKPANILLDQDYKPRLADFGQSRLSHEQTPALGTLFYMAPEQADFKSVPDARWDVYALGVLFYRMLTGQLPYQTPEVVASIQQADGLEMRLIRYRRYLRKAIPPTAHRDVLGHGTLAQILERCLAIGPEKRFGNVQAVLNALDDQALERARKPLRALGILGPALAVLLMWLLTGFGVRSGIKQAKEAIVENELQECQAVAERLSQEVAEEIDLRYRILERESTSLSKLVRSASGKPADSPERKQLQERIDLLQDRYGEATSATVWLLHDHDGKQLARSRLGDPQLDQGTLDQSFANRDYFHGQGYDAALGKKLPPLTQPHRSVVFEARKLQTDVVAFSVPVWSGPVDQEDREVLGVLSLTVEIGNFGEARSGVDRWSVLIDTRSTNRGLILQHPKLESLRKAWLEHRARKGDPHDLRRTVPNEILDEPLHRAYQDPFDEKKEPLLAAVQPVVIPDRPDPEWAVLVQEGYEKIRRVEARVERLDRHLFWYGAVALVVGIVLVTALSGYVTRLLNDPSGIRLSTLWRRRLGVRLESAGSGSEHKTDPSLPPTIPPTDSGGSGISHSDNGQSSVGRLA
jgi:serine/threonine protein kinase